MKYRSEIDGLRAIAVLSVIFAHANFATFGGGFIGVDVFFVISGYLITTIILGEYAQGNFSLASFYQRRARRILPALFFVLLCTIPFAWMWLLPDAYQSFSKSFIMATLSVSNIYFLRKADYFAPEAAEVPLLHTWSLGVEEQFYVLFPLLFLFRLKTKTIFRIVLVVAVASLIASEFGARYYPSANYYLLPTRAWQILCGSLCAFFAHGRTRPVNGTLSLAGLGMVLVAVFLFDPTTRVPSLAALLPVAGACLFLLFASRDTIAGQVLSLSPLVWIGKISFSAYLWHQPVFAFWRIRSLEPPSQWTMAGLILVVFILAALSWRFIEQPFRHGKASLPRVAGVVVACVAGLTGFASWGVFKEGLPFRLAPDVRTFVENTSWSEKCLFQVKDDSPDVPDKECIFNAGTAETYAIWGDSIGASLAPALQDALLKRGAGLVQLTHGYCAPIIGVSTGRAEGAVNCDDFNRRAMAYLLQSNVDTVVLTAFWVNFFNAPYVRIDNAEYPTRDTVIPDIERHFRETIETLKAGGKRVLVIYPSPLFDKSIKDVMAAQIIKGEAVPSFEYSTADFKTVTARSYSILDAAVPSDVAKVLPEMVFCGQQAAQMCFFGRNGVAYIADRGHYTKAGATMVVDQLMSEMGEAEKASAMAVETN
ncbi:acyltransferase family protein [Agrobacterium sp. BA1120]|uniref:acyltransferase family protein n=1 Tax=Agrobacterium sp. BA1120 TaxID=3228927 RepID=UPI003369CB74